jgi:hypothetical protein
MDEPSLKPAIVAADAGPLATKDVKEALNWDSGLAGAAGKSQLPCLFGILVQRSNLLSKM